MVGNQNLTTSKAWHPQRFRRQLVLFSRMIRGHLLNVPHLQFLTSSAFFIDNRSCHERNSSFPHSVLTCLHLYSSISYPCLYLKALLLVPCVCFPCTAKDSVLSLSFPFPLSSVSPSLLGYSSQ